MGGYKNLGWIILLSLAINLFYSNCSEVEFQNVTEKSKTGGPITPYPPLPPKDDNEDEDKDPEIICGGSLTDEDCDEGDIKEGKGWIGRLLYYPQVYDNSAISHQVDSLIENEFVFAAPIYFNQVFVPTLHFDRGFPYGGDVFKKPNGETLMEGFAIELFTKFRLRSDQAPGDYQFAILSDDGAKLLNLDNGELLVNSDGAHATKMACGETVSIAQGQSVNLRLRYYQGPRHEIALTVLVRKVQAGSSNIHCGATSTYAFFYPSQTAKASRAAPDFSNYWFAELLDAGWKVPAPDNFILPQ